MDDDGQCVRERSRRGQRPPAGQRRRIRRQRARQLLPRRGPGHGHADLAGVHDHPPVPELRRGRRQPSARPEHGRRAAAARRRVRRLRGRDLRRGLDRDRHVRRHDAARRDDRRPAARQRLRGAPAGQHVHRPRPGHGPRHVTRVHDHDRLHQLPDRWRPPPVSGRRRQPSDGGQPDRRRKRRPHRDGPGHRGPQLGQLERLRTGGPDRPHRHRGREHGRLGAHQRRPVHVRGCARPPALDRDRRQPARRRRGRAHRDRAEQRNARLVELEPARPDRLALRRSRSSTATPGAGGTSSPTTSRSPVPRRCRSWSAAAGSTTARTTTRR